MLVNCFETFSPHILRVLTPAKNTKQSTKMRHAKIELLWLRDNQPSISYQIYTFCITLFQKIIIRDIKVRDLKISGPYFVSKIMKEKVLSHVGILKHCAVGLKVRLMKIFSSL